MQDYNETNCNTMQDNNITDIEILQDVSPTGKQRPWSEKKLNNQLLATAYDSVNESKAFRLRQCSNFLTFSVNPCTGAKTLKTANFCRVRLCPVCQWRRSLKVFGQMTRIIDAINATKPLAYIFLTFSVVNCQPEDLDDSLNKIIYSFKKFTKNVAFKKAVKGWYRGLEVTHNLNKYTRDKQGNVIANPCYDTFHPHIHMICAVNDSYFSGSNYIAQSKWAEMWKSSSGVDYDPQFYIKRVKGNTSEAIAEVAKYPLKDGDYIIPTDWDMTVNTVRVLDNALDNRRFVAFGGVFREWHKKLNLDDSENGDFIHADEYAVSDSYPLATYVWNTGYTQYTREP